MHGIRSQKLLFIEGKIQKSYSTDSAELIKREINNYISRCWLSATATPKIAELMLIYD